MEGPRVGVAYAGEAAAWALRFRVDGPGGGRGGLRGRLVLAQHAEDPQQIRGQVRREAQAHAGARMVEGQQRGVQGEAGRLDGSLRGSP